MSVSFFSFKSFDVVIEVGHKASLKEKQDLNGNTHKWNAFVRSGDSQQQLEKIVKKVVFNLHETFKNPTRTCTTQPYCVKESGYGQFEFPIDIYFHGTDNKYSINYYLELPSLNTTQPLCRVRKEIITFINPCPEFRKVLIEGGGILKKHPIATATTAPAATSNNINNNNNNLVVINANLNSTTTLNDSSNKLDAKSSTYSFSSSSSTSSYCNSLTSPVTNSSSSSTTSSHLNSTAEKKQLNLKKVNYSFVF